MPTPTFQAPEGQKSAAQLQDWIIKMVRDLNYILENLDTVNINRLDADVIIANTITANKLSVTQLSAIAADLGTITAGIITGALIQNQTSNANRVYINSAGFHSNDAAGVERIVIGTTPANGAKALITNDSAGANQGVYTYDTASVDAASRTGQFITAHGSYILLDNAGDIRMQDAGSKGFRTSAGGYPEMNDGFGWVNIAKKGLTGTKVYYVSDTSGGAVTRKLTFTDGVLTSET